MQLQHQDHGMVCTVYIVFYFTATSNIKQVTFVPFFNNRDNDSVFPLLWNETDREHLW